MNLFKTTKIISLISAASILAGCSRLSFTDPAQEQPTEQTSEPDTSGNTEQTPDTREYLSVVVPKRLTTLNPTQIGDIASASALNMIGEGLYRKMPDGSITEGVITGEEPSVNSRTLRFQIKEDAFWSNGDPVIAQDFIVAWKSLINPENNNYYADILNNIVSNAEGIQNGNNSVDNLGVEAIDNKTLEITLANPIDTYDQLEELLAFPALHPVPSNFIQSDNVAGYGNNANNTLSNGPYKVGNWQSGWETWEFSKNAGYWNGEQYPTETISYQISNSADSATSAFNNQVFDIMSGFISEESQSESTQGIYLAFNEYNNAENIETPLASQTVREVFSKAIDKEKLVSNLDWNIEIANSLLPPALTEGTEQNFSESDNYSSEELSTQFNAYLNEIDYEAMELDLLVDETQFSTEVAEQIRTQLESKIEGLSINLTQVPNSMLNNRLQNREYDMAIMSKNSWDGNDPLRFYSQFISNHSTNITGYENEEYDALFEDETYSESINQETFAQANELLKNDYAVEPLLFLNTDDKFREEAIDLISDNIMPWFDYYQSPFNSGQYTIPQNQ